MRLGIKLLRWLHPEDEKKRMELRYLIHCVEAHAEDLIRKLKNGHDHLAKENESHH